MARCPRWVTLHRSLEDAGRRFVMPDRRAHSSRERVERLGPRTTSGGAPLTATGQSGSPTLGRRRWRPSTLGRARGVGRMRARILGGPVIAGGAIEGAIETALASAQGRVQPSTRCGTCAGLDPRAAADLGARGCGYDPRGGLRRCVVRAAALGPPPIDWRSELGLGLLPRPSSPNRCRESSSADARAAAVGTDVP
jgi:hypothetical protein